MKKKLLFVVTKSNFGGAQRYVYDLATSVALEYDVAVAFGPTPDGSQGILAQRLDGKNIRTILVPELKRDVSVFQDVHAFFALLELFKKERPDIVHLNSSKAGGIGALSARLAGIPRIIFTVHGWPFEEKRNVISRFLMYISSWITALLSHAVIVVSDFDRAIARNMPLVGKKTVRIYNGIKPLTFDSGDVVRHSFPKEVHIVGTIGELTANKNQIALIEQAKNDPNMYVAIVGDGEDRSMLKRKIEEYGLQHRVKLFGFMLANTVLKGFDSFTLPSIKEGLPYVLIEARVAGLPIEANRVGGVGEILDAKDVSEFSLERMVEKTVALYSTD